MRFYTFDVVIEKEPDDPGYFAYIPELPGCVTGGLTVEETRENMREALALYLESLRADGIAIPQPERPVVREQITLAVPA
ncbi:MAG: type II toxin-antitoxin system HicB family antitoxin [Dehalococcoidia bacterium]